MNTGNEWAKHRRFLYGGGVIMFIVAMGIYFSWDVLVPTPTCADGKQNGYESGVDCGGACSLRCQQEIIPLSVVWARSVKVSTSTYDLLAYISNKNVDASPGDLPYLFIVYDKEGNEITRVNGSTLAPTGGSFPIIEQNVRLSAEPYSVNAVLASNVPYYKVSENPSQPTLRVGVPRFERGTISRVYATVTNTKRLSFRDIKVRVLLYDTQGNAFAGGETIIPQLAKEGTENIVFTWDMPFAEAPTKITVTPILDPFLGSK